MVETGEMVHGEMNMDIYKLDLMSEKRAEKDAWREATDLSNLAEDDE